MEDKSVLIWVRQYIIPTG